MFNVKSESIQNIWISTFNRDSLNFGESATSRFQSSAMAAIILECLCIFYIWKSTPDHSPTQNKDPKPLWLYGNIFNNLPYHWCIKSVFARNNDSLLHVTHCEMRLSVVSAGFSFALQTFQPIVQWSILLKLWSRSSTSMIRDLHLPLMPLVAIQNIQLMYQPGFTVS
jgi:hypothetical protein